MHFRSCNCCAVDVSEVAHNDHMKILDVLFAYEVEGIEDVFVHQRGGPDNYDDKGNVVVCHQDFIEEVAHAIRLPEKLRIDPQANWKPKGLGTRSAWDD